MDFRADLTAEIPYLRRFARALTGDPGLADDLVQDCLERALVKSHLYDPSRPLRAWLYAILRNIHVGGLRRKTRGRVVKSVDELAAGEDRVEPGQDHRLALLQVSAALDRLPDVQREVILLVVLEDMSYRDVAEITGVPVGTVMSRLSRGRSLLRSLIGESPHSHLRRIK